MNYKLYTMGRKSAELVNTLLPCTLFLCFALVSLSYGSGGEGDDLAYRDEEYHPYDKDAIIQTFQIDEDIIDCIDIHKQPAFMHPLLINHTIQLKPTHHPMRMGANKKQQVEVSHPQNLSKSCPEATIPVQRMTGNYEHSRDISLTRFFPRHREIQDQKDSNGRTFTYAAVQLRGEKYFGGRAKMNVWNPKVHGADDEASGSHIWLASDDNLVVLMAGWMVYPSKFGDDKTRFHVFFTVDGSKTNCYDLLCPGFVQMNDHNIINSLLNPVSVYGGDQYEIDVQIFKDRVTQHWWVALDGEPVGYWPKELVAARMAQGADVLAFGGALYRSVANPEMGSGHVASEGYRKASYFREVRIVDTNNSYAHPKDSEVQTRLSCSSCYDLQVDPNKYGPWGYTFYYGGPAPSCNC